MNETDIKYFDEREERAVVLAEILRQGRPRLSLTLIANIHL